MIGGGWHAVCVGVPASIHRKGRTTRMTVQTSHHYRSGTGIQSPIDDQLYDLLQAIVSKCEAIEAYAKYEEDADGDAKSLFQELARDDTRHAERLLETLRTRLNR
jgi:rubrerythrin